VIASFTAGTSAALLLHGCGGGSSPEPSPGPSPAPPPAPLVDCDGLTETTVDLNARVQMTEDMLGDWVASAPNYPGRMKMSGFKAEQGGRVTVSITFEVDNLWSSLLGSPNPAEWCEQKGDHTFTIDFRSMCKDTAADTADYSFYKFQAETQLGTDCAGQQLGICRILKVAKNPVNGTRRWVESQDGPEGDLSRGPGGPGGSLIKTGESFTANWTACSEAMEIEYVVAEMEVDGTLSNFAV